MSVAGSFTVEFPQHLQALRVQHAIDMLQSNGAHIEPLAAHTFLVTCNNERQVNDGGCACFTHTCNRSLAW